MKDYSNLYFYYSSENNKVSLIPEEHMGCQGLPISALKGILLSNKNIPKGMLEVKADELPRLAQEFDGQLREFKPSLRQYPIARSA